MLKNGESYNQQFTTSIGQTATIVFKCSLTGDVMDYKPTGVFSCFFGKCTSSQNTQSGCIAGDNFAMAPGTTHLANDGVSWTCTSSNAGARLDMTFVKSRVSECWLNGGAGPGCGVNGQLVKVGDTFNVPSTTTGTGLLKGQVFKCVLSNGSYKAELNGEQIALCQQIVLCPGCLVDGNKGIPLNQVSRVGDRVFKCSATGNEVTDVTDG